MSPTTATTDDRPPSSADGVVANHHAAHPGFAGAGGAAMGLLFAANGRRNARLAADLAGIGPGDHLIDVGCGPGTAVREAGRRGATAVGVDPAPVMLSVARALTWRRRTSLRWAEGAAELIPAADGSATVAWSLLCVHHWASVERGLAEVRRVLAPDGRFLAVERQTTADATGVASHGWTRAQADVFAEACRAAGLRDVDITSGIGRRGAQMLVVRAVRP
jgi:ubiquinone/menaquinone biosynthesis C-methylase UbiE